MKVAYKAISDFYGEYKQTGVITVTALIETVDRLESAIKTMNENVAVANTNSEIANNNMAKINSQITDLYGKYNIIINYLMRL